MNLTVTNELEDPDGEVAFRRTVTLSDVRLSQRHAGDEMQMQFSGQEVSVVAEGTLTTVRWPG